MLFFVDQPLSQAQKYDLSWNIMINDNYYRTE